jgi:hypothetical protein
MGANVEREAQERRRRERLAASLRENLKRRKAQQRGRAALDAPTTSETPAPEATGARDLKSTAGSAGRTGQWIA